MSRHALAGLTACVALAASPALAHPHVFVSSKTEVLYAPDGSVTGLRHIWSFDEAYSAYMVQGLDKNGDGKVTPDELAAALAELGCPHLGDKGCQVYAGAR